MPVEPEPPSRHSEIGSSSTSSARPASPLKVEHLLHVEASRDLFLNSPAEASTQLRVPSASGASRSRHRGGRRRSLVHIDEAVDVSRSGLSSLGLVAARVAARLRSLRRVAENGEEARKGPFARSAYAVTRSARAPHVGEQTSGREVGELDADVVRRVRQHDVGV
jgi:hypothetical protein